MFPFPNPNSSASVTRLSALMGALASTTLTLSSLLLILGGLA